MVMQAQMNKKGKNSKDLRICVLPFKGQTKGRKESSPSKRLKERQNHKFY